MLWNVILTIATRQQNLITRSEILEAGGSDDWIQWAISDGRLKRVRRGVYRIAGAMPEYQPLMAACLAAGKHAAASHLAAAHMWGAEQVLGGRLEITTFDNRDHRLPGVVTHRSTIDPTIAITRHLDLPVVVPPLTVVQLAGRCDPYLVKKVANDLVKRNWTTFPAILEWIDHLGGQGHNGLRELCLQAIEVGGHYDSPAARSLCHELTRAGAPPYHVDYPVQTPEGVLLVDIAWPPPKVGLEYNGVRDHNSPLARLDDARRRNRLTALGWRILDADKGMSHREIVAWALAALAAAESAS